MVARTESGHGPPPGRPHHPACAADDCLQRKRRKASAPWWSRTVNMALPLASETSPTWRRAASARVRSAATKTPTRARSRSGHASRLLVPLLMLSATGLGELLVAARAGSVEGSSTTFSRYGALPLALAPAPVAKAGRPTKWPGSVDAWSVRVPCRNGEHLAQHRGIEVGQSGSSTSSQNHGASPAPRTSRSRCSGRRDLGRRRRPSTQRSWHAHLKSTKICPPAGAAVPR